MNSEGADVHHSLAEIVRLKLVQDGMFSVQAVSVALADAKE